MCWLARPGPSSAGSPPCAPSRRRRRRSGGAGSGRSSAGGGGGAAAKPEVPGPGTRRPPLAGRAAGGARAAAAAAAAGVLETRRAAVRAARASAGRWRTDRQPAGSRARLAEASPPARKRGRPTPPPGSRVSGFVLLVSTLRGGETLRRRAWKRQPRPQAARARGRRTAVGAGFYRNSATSRRRVFLGHRTHHYRKHLYCTGAVTSRDLEFINKNEGWYTKTFCRLSLSSTVTRKQLRDGAVSVCTPSFLPPSHAAVWLDFFLMHCFCLKNNKYTPATPSGSPPSSQGVPDPMKNRKLGSYLYLPSPNKNQSQRDRPSHSIIFHLVML
ncbi:dapper homolog 3-like [Dipodomys spectabilis]|uniref:dapper homolog 3-like n=1 Tax=Dipodomys spectabilis TaxID=105255 RepID=UPI001C54767D|nr:dapper homolog 3-like [Dipodomys spectabilis]